MTQYKLDNTFPSIASITLLMSFPALAVVLINPALPAIGEYFKLTGQKSQSLITIFLLSYTLGLLIYLPLANKFGKIASYLGRAIFILTCAITLFSAYTHNFNQLIKGRLFMALGSGAMAMPSIFLTLIALAIALYYICCSQCIRINNF